MVEYTAYLDTDVIQDFTAMEHMDFHHFTPTMAGGTTAILVEFFHIIIVSTINKILMTVSLLCTLFYLKSMNTVAASGR